MKIIRFGDLNIKQTSTRREREGRTKKEEERKVDPPIRDVIHVISHKCFEVKHLKCNLGFPISKIGNHKKKVNKKGNKHATNAQRQTL